MSVLTPSSSAEPSRNSGAPVSGATVPQPRSPGSRGPRRRARLALGGAVAGAAAIAGSLYLTNDSDGNEPPVEATPIRAVQAERRDLVEFTELDGTLGYVAVRTATAASDGVVTAISGDGETLGRGDRAFEINGRPTTVLFGDVPFHRQLDEGLTGDDVLLLERNLASLGHHTEQDDSGDEIDSGFSVDGVFDAATTEAVRRWQADIGIEETGVVQPIDAVVVSGPSIVSNNAAQLGDRIQAGAPVLDLNMSASTAALYSAHSGEIELAVEVGASIASGDVLYTVDGLPVIAVVIDPLGDVSLDRDLGAGISDGDDVEVLEQLLADLGYTADDELDVDDEFDEATTEAISDWQDDLRDVYEDVEVDGVIGLDDLIVVEPGMTVGEITDREADVTATGSELFTADTGDPVRIVSTSIAVADRAKLTEGAAVEVELPDGEVVTGTVQEVATSSTRDPGDPDADPVLSVDVALDDVPAAIARFSDVDVSVRLVDELAAAATVVPVSALVATGDGGYAVEVVTGERTTELVAVDPGLFADGSVAVDGIEPGTAVVVPS